MNKLIKILICSLLVIIILLPMAPQARAWVGIGDVSGLDISQTINNMKKDILDGKGKMMDSLLDAVVQRIVNKIVDQITNWIQGGGKPQFVTDWNKFLFDDVNKIVQDEVINKLGLSNLCQPFKLQLQLAFLPVKKFDKAISCTFDQIGSNLTDFYNDFSSGGWIAFSQGLEPQNNYFGQVLMIGDEISSKKAKELTKKISETSSGKGFLSQKKCKIDIFQTEGEFVQNFPPDQYPQYYDNPDNPAEAYPKGFEKITRSDGFVGVCPQSEVQIVTPGDTIGALAAKAVGTDIDKIINTKTIVSAIINAVVNRVMKEGLAEISKSDTPDMGEDMDIQSGFSSDDNQGIDLDFMKGDKVMKTILTYIQKELNKILVIRGKAANYTKEMVSIVNNTSPTCSPILTPTEVKNIKSVDTNVKKQYSSLQGKIKTLKDFMDADIGAELAEDPIGRIAKNMSVLKIVGDYLSPGNLNQILFDKLFGKYASMKKICIAKSCIPIPPLNPLPGGNQTAKSAENQAAFLAVRLGKLQSRCGVSTPSTSSSINAAVHQAINSMLIELLPIKKESLGVASTTLSIFENTRDIQQITPSACPPQISSSTIANASTTRAFFETQVTELLSFQNSSTIDINSPNIQNILSENAVDDANEELEGIKDIFNSAQTQYNNCFRSLSGIATTTSIIINSGATTTASSTVSLAINAGISDLAENTTEMHISNNSDFSTGQWEPYSVIKNWLLNAPLTTGIKTVYIRFRDALYNISGEYSDSINLQ